MLGAWFAAYDQLQTCTSLVAIERHISNEQQNNIRQIHNKAKHINQTTEMQLSDAERSGYLLRDEKLFLDALSNMTATSLAYEWI